MRTVVCAALVVFVHRLFCIAHAATHAVLCIQSWTRGGSEYMKDGMRPSEAADRREVITLLFVLVKTG